MSDKVIENEIIAKYWNHKSNYFDYDRKTVQRIQDELKAKCKSYTITMYQKVFESRKISCIFIDGPSERINSKSKGFDYQDTPAYPWSQAPLDILNIKEKLEKDFGVVLDYVLCHVYRGITERISKEKKIKEVGQDYIGWHNDKEALNSEIFSVTFGASRRFQFRLLKDKNGYTDEMWLHKGDLVHMFGPRTGQLSCQKVYKHRVPQMTIKDLKKHVEKMGHTLPKGRVTHEKMTEFVEENDIAPTRFNLTFRQFEN
jgi:hypothetical protein